MSLNSQAEKGGPKYRLRLLVEIVPQWICFEVGCTHNFFKVRLGGNPTKYDDGSLLSKELLGNTRKVYKKFLKFLRSIRREDC